METEIFKSRSSSSCIKVAYMLMITNLKTILKKTWIPVLFYALVVSALTMTYIPDASMMNAGMSRPLITLIMLGLLWILDVIANILFMTSIISLLNGISFKKNITRSIVYTAVTMGISILFAALLYGVQTIVPTLFTTKTTAPSTIMATTLAIQLGMLLLALIILLPFSFSSIKYLIDPTTRFKAMFTRNYIVGWKYWGYLLLTLFITAIITCIISFIIFAPFTVIVTAQVVNQIGMLDGDPSGAPSYLPYLLYTTSTLCIFLLGYIMMWAYFVLYYAYGSIEATEKEKAEEKAKYSNELITDNNNTK